jgi:abortive infection bacteriophage resistance protein
MTNYIKQPLSFEQQADLLILRGLIISDKNTLVERLRNVNYTRLSAYWHTFQDINNNYIFLPNTQLETIWQRYIFDHELRLIVMDAIGYIEVAILRTRAVEQFTLKHGPFGYIEKGNFAPHFTDEKYTGMMQEIGKIITERKKRDESVQEYYSIYTKETYLPLWMLVEFLSFGTLFTLFKHMNDAEKKTLARQLDLPDDILQSWLLSLNYSRNLCAHHERLWNRELSLRPALPRKKVEWTSLIQQTNNRVFITLTILNYLIKKINPESKWDSRVKNLLESFP